MIVLNTRNDLVNKFVRRITSSDFSHIGLMVNATLDKATELLVYDKNSELVVEYPGVGISNTIRTIPFSEWCKEGRVNIVVRKIHMPEKTEKMFFHFLNIALKEKLPYDSRFGAFLDSVTENKKKRPLLGFYCSSFVTAAFQYCGLISPEFNNNIFTPNDFTGQPLKCRLQTIQYLRQ